MGRHRIATEKIVQVDILNLIDTRDTRDQLADLGHGAHVHGQADEGIDDLPPTIVGRRGNREQHLGNAVFLDQAFNVTRIDHLEAIDHRILGSRIVIDKRHHAILLAVMQRSQ